VVAIHSSCQALSPTSWFAQCRAERNTFADFIPAQPTTGSSAPRSVLGLASGLQICLGLCERLLSPLGVVAPPGPSGLAGIITHSMRFYAHLLQN
jgi:hypothetical protein